MKTVRVLRDRLVKNQPRQAGETVVVEDDYYDLMLGSRGELPDGVILVEDPADKNPPAPTGRRRGAKSQKVGPEAD